MTINVISSIWIIFNSIGLFYGLRVYIRSSKAHKDIREAARLNLIDEDKAIQESVLYTAKLNQTNAAALSLFMAVYLLIGILSLFAYPGTEILIQAIRIGLVIGDIVAVYVIWQIDDGHSKLRSIVGGRREGDR